jgi:excisionase family DNA binding protein
MTTSKYDHTLTVRDAATYLRLAVSTLNKLRCTGGGPTYLKLGRSVRYERGDLDEWLASHRVANTSEATARLCAQKMGG